MIRPMSLCVSCGLSLCCKRTDPVACLCANTGCEPACAVGFSEATEARSWILFVKHLCYLLGLVFPAIYSIR